MLVLVLRRALERALAQISAETQTEPSVIHRVGEVLLGASLEELKAEVKAEDATFGGNVAPSLILQIVSV